MAIWRRCSKRTCMNPRRCLEHLWFDVTYRGTRFRVPVNEFAIPRMDANKQRPIESLEEARDWERVFIGEIKAGRDPRRPRPVQKSSNGAPKDVASFLDAYVERCVTPAALKSVNSTCSRVDVLKKHLGELPLDALEEPDEINRFKSGSDYAKRVELATIHRTLETLRAAMNWGMAQTPPLFRKSPFHRFGVRMNKKGETVRDRRLSREEEKKLLDAALQKMNTPEHQFVGPLLHDRLIGALELCCRRGEMLLIQNKRVNWETFQIGIPGATAKDKENRRIPFNPEGRLAAILERRTKLGPDAYVFGTATGEYQPELQTAWETLRLRAHGIEPRPTRKGAAWNREQALLERHGRGTTARTGGELEQPTPTTSTRIRSLKWSSGVRKQCRPARRSQIGHNAVPGGLKFGCGGTQPPIPTELYVVAA